MGPSDELLAIIVHVAFVYIFGNRSCSFVGVAGEWMGVASAGFACGRNRQHVCQGAGTASTLAQALVPP